MQNNNKKRQSCHGLLELENVSLFRNLLLKRFVEGEAYKKYVLPLSSKEKESVSWRSWLLFFFWEFWGQGASLSGLCDPFLATWPLFFGNGFKGFLYALGEEDKVIYMSEYCS